MHFILDSNSLLPNSSRLKEDNVRLSRNGQQGLGESSESELDLWTAKQKIREQDIIILRLQKENNDLHLRVNELDKYEKERKGLGTENKNETKVMELQNKLQISEEKSLQLEMENNALTSNVQNLKQEVEEVKDNFCDDNRIMNEYRKLKKELMMEAKNCRALQLKLKKAEKFIVKLAADNREESESGVASAMDIMSQIKQINTDNILIINSILNNKKMSGI